MARSAAPGITSAPAPAQRVRHPRSWRRLLCREVKHRATDAMDAAVNEEAPCSTRAWHGSEGERDFGRASSRDQSRDSSAAEIPGRIGGPEQAGGSRRRGIANLFCAGEAALCGDARGKRFSRKGPYHIEQRAGRPVRVCAKLEAVAAAAASATGGTQELRAQFERNPMVRSMLQRFGGKISEVNGAKENPDGKSALSNRCFRDSGNCRKTCRGR